ncbi:MAG: hypothetical protein ABI333_04620 [bacterium]
MRNDIRSRLRALYERELPALSEHVHHGDGLATDRRLLAIFSEVLEDPAEHEALLALEEEAQRTWLVERADEAAEPGTGEPGASEDDTDDQGECVRPAASAWVGDYFSGQLAPSAEPGLWRHLDDCGLCRLRYRTRWLEEREGAPGPERQRERLARGLPWSAVSEPMDLAEHAAKGEPGAAEPDAESGDPEADDPTGEPGEQQEPPRPSPARWIVYGVALVLAIVGSVLILTNPTGELKRLKKERPGRPQRLQALPAQGLRLSLLRYDTTGRFEPPWRVVQSAVGAGDRLQLNLSAREGPGRYLAVAALDERGRIKWLHPAAVLAGKNRMTKVALPAEERKLAQEIRVPDDVERLVFYAVLADRPVALAELQQALLDAFEQPSFMTTPPLLAIDRTLQYHLSLDVLQ